MSFYFNGNTPKKILYNGLNVAKLVYNGVVVWMSKVLATISGILPLTLTDCTGDDLVDYKIYGKSEHEELPDEYQQVEYIESTGTQYIDTGINVNTTTSRYETKINPSSVSGASGIFGTRNYTSSNLSSMNVFIIGGTFRLDWLTGAGNYNVNNISSNTDYTISITRGLATINNVDYTSEQTTSVDSSYTFYIGNFNNAGSVYSNGFSGKIYYSKLYNNNILVFDGVPCYRKSDNEIGMYDLVSNTFFTNAGTGTFTTGAVVSKKSVGDLVTDTSDINYGKYKIPVLTNSHTTNIYLNKPLRRASKLPYGYTELEHIRSTGTQYIDTGFKPNQDTRVYIDFYASTMSQSSPLLGARRSDSTNSFSFWNLNSSKFRADYYSDDSNYTYIFSPAPTESRYLLDFNKNVVKLNATSYMFNNINFQSDYNMYLFACNTADSTNNRIWKGNIYICKIYDNGTLVRNFIPCKNTLNVVGLYDTVNNVFYSNAGSGSFIAGAEVETVYYTDYLDYENQKVVRNVDDNYKGLDTSIEESIVLPAVPTDEGTVTVDVNTEIAPSHAEIKYYKNGS